MITDYTHANDKQKNLASYAAKTFEMRMWSNRVLSTLCVAVPRPSGRMLKKDDATCTWLLRANLVYILVANLHHHVPQTIEKERDRFTRVNLKYYNHMQKWSGIVLYMYIASGAHMYLHRRTLRWELFRITPVGFMLAYIYLLGLFIMRWYSLVYIVLAPRCIEHLNINYFSARLINTIAWRLYDLVKLILRNDDGADWSLIIVILQLGLVDSLRRCAKTTWTNA